MEVILKQYHVLTQSLKQDTNFFCKHIFHKFTYEAYHKALRLCVYHLKRDKDGIAFCICKYL